MRQREGRQRRRHGGDGVGALVLKRLRDAEADGDVIHGVIIGSGTNQDGRTNGITAPSVVSQIELERNVHARFGIDPATIGYVETHGTGTKLGDPIELEALSTVFREKTDRKHYCALGSLKSNIGHASSAAGVAAMQKVLLSMRHRMLAPTLHVSRENSHFDFSGSPFYVNRTAKAWSAIEGAPLRACVNSFGYSGTNAHVIVEAYTPPVDASASGGVQAIPLSARTPERLRRKVEDLLAAIATDTPPAVAAIAWTLQTGRDAMEHRVGFVASTIDELQRRLRALEVVQIHLAPADQEPALRQGPGLDAALGRDQIGRGSHLAQLATQRFDVRIDRSIRHCVAFTKHPIEKLLPRKHPLWCHVQHFQ